MEKEVFCSSDGCAFANVKISSDVDRYGLRISKIFPHNVKWARLNQKWILVFVFCDCTIRMHYSNSVKFQQGSISIYFEWIFDFVYHLISWIDPFDDWYLIWTGHVTIRNGQVPIVSGRKFSFRKYVLFCFSVKKSYKLQNFKLYVKLHRFFVRGLFHYIISGWHTKILPGLTWWSIRWTWFSSFAN